jgi:hypothetical protein
MRLVLRDVHWATEASRGCVGPGVDAHQGQGQVCSVDRREEGPGLNLWVSAEEVWVMLPAHEKASFQS